MTHDADPQTLDVTRLTPSPPVTAPDAAEAVRSCFTLAGHLARLPGEADDNFLLHADDGRRYVVKVAHLRADPAVVGVQVRVLRHIEAAAPELPVPRVRPAAGGQPWATVPDGPLRGRLGKPMGNGMPIAGVAARPEILEEFGHKIRYFNTFGGNSVCIAAAAAVLDVIEAEGLRENALTVGGYLRDTLEAIARDTPRISAVRGAGLYAAADFTEPGTGEPDGDTAIRVVNGLRERRVLISATGPHGHTLKIRPPLPFSQANVDQFAEALTATLRSL